MQLRYYLTAKWQESVVAGTNTVFEIVLQMNTFILRFILIWIQIRADMNRKIHILPDMETYINMNIFLEPDMDTGICGIKKPRYGYLDYFAHANAILDYFATDI